MQTRGKFQWIWILAICFSVLSGNLFAKAPPKNLPTGFRLIGNYQLKSKIKVENGKSMAVVISPLTYRVYSDGIDVRVYCRSSDEEIYTAYQIYRSDGVGVSKSSGEIQVVAGVQGKCLKGEMLRQISVTRNTLTMVKMPPRSDRVEVTQALSYKPQS